MLNLNQVIKTFFIIVFLCPASYGQLQLEVPQEFQSLSVNARALEKDFEFTVDELSSQNVQNFILDKTGVILHLVSSPKIKDSKTKLRVISASGEEEDLFTFKDGTLFALTSPEKTYSVIQEISPDCSSLIKAFALNEEDVICPDTIAYKLYSNIMITEDTSYRIRLQTPNEFYSLMANFPEDTIQISNPLSDENIQNTNIANMFPNGELCLVSHLKTNKKFKSSQCQFIDDNIFSIITFKDSFVKKDNIPQEANLLFSLPLNLFNKLNHSSIFEYEEEKTSTASPIEINIKSGEKLFFDNFKSNLSLNLGEILKTKTKIRKNIFNLDNSIEINKELRKAVFNISLLDLEAIVNPLSNITNDCVLTNVSLSGKKIKSLDLFNISLDNNILVKNLKEPEEEKKERLQSVESENLQIKAFLPKDVFDINLDRTYTFVEQNIAPSVDEKGNNLEVINNKSRLELTLSKAYKNTDLTTVDNLDLQINQASSLLEDKTFQDQLELSGFLFPPDFRPVLEDNYRANVLFSMTLNLKNDELLKINYSDLKTKDEVQITNFFKFSFLPTGLYNAHLNFNGDREVFFKNAELVKED